VTTKFQEGNLEITFPSSAKARKYDGPSHGLSHCMKAVDFIVELGDKILFIELKDPDNPKSRPAGKERFIQDFQSKKIHRDLKYKYRDSFLYEWAAGRVSKPIHYYVLIALDTLKEGDIIAQNDELKRQLPVGIPPAVPWRKEIAVACAVFNLETWNKHLPHFKITRGP